MIKSRFIAGAATSVGVGAVILASSAQADWYTYSDTTFDYTANGQTIAYQVDVVGSQHLGEDKAGNHIYYERPLSVDIDFGDGSPTFPELPSDGTGCTAMEYAWGFSYHSPSAPEKRRTHHYAKPGTYTVTTNVYFCGTFNLNDWHETEKWTVTVGADGSVTPTPSPTAPSTAPVPTTSAPAPSTSAPAPSTSSTPAASTPGASPTSPAPTSTVATPTSSSSASMPTSGASEVHPTTSPADHGASTVVGPVVQTDKSGTSNDMVTLVGAIAAAGAAGAGVALRRRTKRS